MELGDFVENTLLAVVNGVVSAQEKTKTLGNGEILINPRVMGNKNALTASFGSIINMVEFDVAVSTVDSNEQKKGVGIFVAPFSIGGKQIEGSQSTVMSRIKFNVPVSYPRE